MNSKALPLHTDHTRSWRENRFVYPVLSRRSKGISIGINLNPDKVCNFDCIYCQVDRRSEAETRFVETGRVLDELDGMLRLVTGGDLFRDEKFQSVPRQLRRLSDIAFSGDGEPTTYRNFDEIVEAVVELKRRHQQQHPGWSRSQPVRKRSTAPRLRGTLGAVAPAGGLFQPVPPRDVKLVLITNASMFHRPAVRRGLEILDQNNGEIWAKLETGTEDYYRLVERTKVPFQRVLQNITEAARARPLVIQSLFMRIHGAPPPEPEIEAFCGRLKEIIASGGRLKLVQVYTVARQPAESYVAPLTDSEVDAIAHAVRSCTHLPVEVYYGS